MGDFKGPTDAGIAPDQRKTGDQHKPQTDSVPDRQKQLDQLARHPPQDGGVSGDLKKDRPVADAKPPSLDGSKLRDGHESRPGEKNKPLGERITDAAHRLKTEGIDGLPIQGDAVQTLDWYLKKTKNNTTNFKVHRGNGAGDGIRKLCEKAGVPNLYGKAWCGVTVRACLLEAGMTDKKLLQAVLSSDGAMRYAKQNPAQSLDLRTLSDAQRREALSKPEAVKPGDIIVFTKRGHVGMVDQAFDAKAGKLKTIEGNTWGRDKNEPEELIGIPRIMNKEYSLGKLECIIIRPLDAPAVGKSLPVETHDAIRPTDNHSHPSAADAGSPPRLEMNPKRPRDAGPAAGVSYPEAALGRFRGAKPDKVADLMSQHGKLGADTSIPIRDRGNLKDIQGEIVRLKGVHNEYRAWAVNHRDLFGSEPRLVPLENNIMTLLARLETYAKERIAQRDTLRDSAVKVLFDGRQITICDTSKKDKIVVITAASSGMDERNSLVDTSVSSQKEVNRGPIPAGTYRLDLREVKPTLNPLDWPAWGTKRLTIHPFATTATFGRGGFFIHGGLSAGSAGCIDIPLKVDTFIQELSNMVRSKEERIKLVVDYSPDLSRWRQEIGSSAPKDKNPKGDLINRLKGLKTITAREVIDKIPALREQMGIPQEGFVGKIKKFDLFRGSKEPLVSSLFASLAKHADSAARQIQNLKKTNPNVDLALTLAIVKREDGQGIGSFGKLRNSIVQGGLDSFYAHQAMLKEKGFLPADFPQIAPTQSPWVWQGVSYNNLGNNKAQVLEQLLITTSAGNELTPQQAQKASKQLGPNFVLGKQQMEKYRSVYVNNDQDSKALLQFFPQHIVFPALIPQNRCIEAYGAELGDSSALFRTHARKNGFDLKGLDKQVERVWTAVYFGAPGFGKDLMKEYHKDGKPLSAIISDQKAKESHHVRAGLVAAANAQLVELFARL